MTDYSTHPCWGRSLGELLRLYGPGAIEDVPALINVFRASFGGPIRLLTQQHPQRLAFQPYAEELDLLRDPSDTVVPFAWALLQRNFRDLPSWRRGGKVYQSALKSYLGHELTIVKAGLLPEMTVAQACAFVEDPFCEDAEDALAIYPELG